MTLRRRLTARNRQGLNMTLLGSFVIALAACGTARPQASVTTGTYSPSAQALDANAESAPPRLGRDSNTAELIAGTSEASVRCPETSLSPPARPPRTVGLVIDPGQYGPLQHTYGGGSCQGVNGFTICPMDSSYGAPDAYGMLTLAVDVRGSAGPRDHRPRRPRRPG
jgi:hypothetical protein